MINLTLEQTVELEEALKIKKEAEEIYRDFFKYVKIDTSSFVDGKFLMWADSYNSTYIEVKNGKLVYQCRFLHEKYDVEISIPNIFKLIKEEYRGINHLKSLIYSHKKKETHD